MWPAVDGLESRATVWKHRDLPGFREREVALVRPRGVQNGREIKRGMIMRRIGVLRLLPIVWSRVLIGFCNGMVPCRFSEPMDPAGAEILKSFPPVGVRISQNLSPPLRGSFSKLSPLP